jgi:hypothetical protein
MTRNGPLGGRTDVPWRGPPAVCGGWVLARGVVIGMVAILTAGGPAAAQEDAATVAVRHYLSEVLGDPPAVSMDPFAQHWAWTGARATTEAWLRTHRDIAYRLQLKSVALSNVLRCEEEPSHRAKYARCRIEGLDAVVRILEAELDGDRGRIVVVSWENIAPHADRDEWLVTAVTGFVDVERVGGRWSVRDVSIAH